MEYTGRIGRVEYWTDVPYLYIDVRITHDRKGLPVLQPESKRWLIRVYPWMVLRLRRDGEFDKYAPTEVDFITKRVAHGAPNLDRASTLHVERVNLTNRMHIRRFLRRGNAFSKKIEHQTAVVSLHIAWYNFYRVHETLRVTPAMEAGITNRVWSVEELVTRALAADRKLEQSGPKLNSTRRLVDDYRRLANLHEQDAIKVEEAGKRSPYRQADIAGRLMKMGFHGLVSAYRDAAEDIERLLIHEERHTHDD